MKIEPYSIPRISAGCVDGMFSPLAETIEKRIAFWSAKGGAANEERVRLWEYVRKNVDPATFARIQKKYLVDKAPPNADFVQSEHGSYFLKYIDPVTWFESKLSSAIHIGLDRSPPLDLLDIGTGPGHFPFVARFYGHRVSALDVPPEVHAAAEPRLYDDLCAMYGVTRTPFWITPTGRLPEIGKFDLVTGFMAAFNRSPIEGQDGWRPWTSAEWTSFLRECNERWMKPDGRIHLTLTRGNTPADVWEYLTLRALSANEKTLRIDLQPKDYV